MHRPETSAVSGRRFLFPWLAAQLQLLLPSLTDLDCFFALQLPIIAVTVWLSGEWANLFLPRFGRLMGYLLVTLMICPTITYWTFYDIAIVGFWTACLLLLHHGRYVAYLAVFTLATMNHENILLLVPVAALFVVDRMKLRTAVYFVAGQLVLYGAVRYFTSMVIPADSIVQWGIRDNLFFWRTYSLQTLVFAWSVLLPWWILALRGWKHSPRLVRCSIASLPGLFVVTTLFGRYEEARQFDAFIPSCIGLISCWLNNQLDGHSTRG